MIISAQYISFGTFFLNSLFCARNCTKRIKKAKAKFKRKPKFESFATLIMLHLERPLYSIPLLLNLMVEGKNKLHRVIAVSVAYAVALLTCSYVLLPLLKLAWVSTAIGFYTNGYTPSDNLRGHIADLCSQRQALYDLYWVTNLHIVVKIFLILLSIYLLVIVIRIMIEQLAHIVFDNKK